MATFSVLYWQDIPSQVKAEGGGDEVSLPLPPRFMERIDQVAADRELLDADSYLAHWHWSEPQERAGSAQEVAEAVVAELDAKSTW